MRAPHRTNKGGKSVDGPHAGGTLIHNVDEAAYERSREVRELLPSLFARPKKKPKKVSYLRRVDPGDFLE